MIVHRLGVLSLARITGGIYAILGLLIGSIFAVASIFGAAIGAAAEESAGPLVGAVFGLAAIIVAPIFYGLLGFLGGALTAGAYNVFAGRFGGLEMEVSGGPAIPR